MLKDNKIIVGKDGNNEYGILLDKANRHGFITGATGSGKTTTVKVLAEGFSNAGVPVFIADIKGDLSGIANEGEINENIQERLKKLNIKDFDVQKFPTVFWDVNGENGHPIRVPIKRVGPFILSMMLGLTEVQEGVLNAVFKICEDNGLELIDLNDLKIALDYINENKKDYTSYGNITTQSIGVIQRNLLVLESQGASNFFSVATNESNIYDFNISDLLYQSDNKGFVNILDAQKLFENPDLYASFVLWFLNELFTKLDEIGDTEKPELVFFFDEAHLLFNGMPEYRLKRIVQVVKLIRSKGVGLYFISQSPIDIPDEILNQLGNRIQHTLRAYTPSERKIVESTAKAFRENPKLKTKDEILNLGIGEALVSFQNENGEPEIVHKVTILPPQSSLNSISNMERNKIMNSSSFAGKYDQAVNPESAEEIINRIREEQKKEEEKLAQEKAEKKNPFSKTNIKTKVGNTLIYTITRKVANSFMNSLTKAGKSALTGALKNATKKK